MRLFATFIASFVFAHAALAAPVVRAGSGANAAALQPLIDNFRADLGANNGVGGSFPGGRREINWDGVPDNFAEPNSFPPDFFNRNSPRGVVFSTVLEDSGSALNQFAVSSSQASNVPVRFGNVNGTYPAQFTTFSAQRLFTARGAHAMMVKFYRPGTTTEATTRGFGVVFTDVDLASGGGRSIVYAYAPDGHLLTAAAAPVFNGGLSFVGITFSGDERIGHVIITSGTHALGPTTDDSGGIDVVALDDFIYGEPQPVTGCLFADSFDSCPASR